MLQGNRNIHVSCLHPKVVQLADRLVPIALRHSLSAALPVFIFLIILVYIYTENLSIIVWNFFQL